MLHKKNAMENKMQRASVKSPPLPSKPPPQRSRHCSSSSSISTKSSSSSSVRAAATIISQEQRKIQSSDEEQTRLKRLGLQRSQRFKRLPWAKKSDQVGGLESSKPRIGQKDAKISSWAEFEEKHAWVMEWTDAGEHFYFNINTGESSWTLPPGVFIKGIGKPPSNSSPIEQAEEDEEEVEEVEEHLNLGNKTNNMAHSDDIAWRIISSLVRSEQDFLHHLEFVSQVISRSLQQYSPPYSWWFTHSRWFFARKTSTTCLETGNNYKRSTKDSPSRSNWALESFWSRRIQPMIQRKLFSKDW